MPTEKRYIDVAESAKMIRTALKNKFPGVKFSVKSSRYAGGASVDIKWVDGPTCQEVEKITGPYSGKGFDGMIDMSYSKSSYLLADGTVAYGYSNGTGGSRGSEPGYLDPLPEGAVVVSFGSDYVHCQRDYSDEFLSKRVDEYKQVYSDGKYVFFKPSSKQTWGTAGPSIEVKPWDPNIQTRIGRYVEEYSGFSSN